MAFNAQFFQAEAPRSFSDVVNEGLDTGTKFRAVDRKKKLQDLIAKHTIVDERGIGTLNDVPFLTEAKALGISDEAVPYHAQAKGVLSDATLKEARAAQALEGMGLSPNALRATPPTDLPMTKGAGSNESATATTAGLVDNLRSPAEIAAEQEAKELAGGNTATGSAPAVATPAPVTDTATPDKRTQLEEFLKANYGKKSEEIKKIQNAVGITGKAADGVISKGGRTESALRMFFGMNESPEAGVNITGGEMKPVYAPDAVSTESPAYDFQTTLTGDRVRAEPDPFVLPADDTMYSNAPVRGPLSAIEEALLKDPNAKKQSFNVNEMATAPAGSTTWEPTDGGTRYSQYKTVLDNVLKNFGVKSGTEYLDKVYKSEFLANAPKVPNTSLSMTGKVEDMVKYNDEVNAYNQGLQVAQGKALAKMQAEKEALTKKAQEYGVNVDTGETHKLDIEAKNADIVGRRAGGEEGSQIVRLRDVSESERTKGTLLGNSYLDLKAGRGVDGFEGNYQMALAKSRADGNVNKDVIVSNLVAMGAVPSAKSIAIKSLMSEGGGISDAALKAILGEIGTEYVTDQKKLDKWYANTEANIKDGMRVAGYGIVGDKSAPSKTDELGKTLGKRDKNAPAQAKIVRKQGEKLSDFIKRGGKL